MGSDWTRFKKRDPGHPMGGPAGHPGDRQVTRVNRVTRLTRVKTILNERTTAASY